MLILHQLIMFADAINTPTIHKKCYPSTVQMFSAAIFSLIQKCPVLTKSQFHDLSGILNFNRWGALQIPGSSSVLQPRLLSFCFLLIMELVRLFWCTSLRIFLKFF